MDTKKRIIRRGAGLVLCANLINFSMISFNNYILITSIINTFTIIAIEGVQKTVSKFVSINRVDTRGVLAYFRRKIMLIALVVIPLFLLIGLIRKELLIYFLLAGIIVYFYFIYSVEAGYLNGLLRFKKQGFLRIFQQITKATFIVLFLVWGFELCGAFFGYLLASILIFSIAFLINKGTNKNHELDKISIWGFFIPIAIFNGAIYLTLNGGIIILKFISDLSETLIGNYSSAFTISSIPFALAIGFGVVSFPIISKKMVDNKNINLIIKKLNKYGIILLTYFTCMLILIKDYINLFLYGGKFEFFGSLANYLILGFFILGINYMLLTMLLAVKEERNSMKISIIIILVPFILLTLISLNSLGVYSPIISLILSSLLGLLFIGLFLYKKFNISIINTNFFVSIAMIGLTYLLTRIYNSLAEVIIKVIFISIFYLGILLLLRLIKKEDVIELKNWL